MALTDTKIRQAKIKAKPYKLGDGDGLYVLVHPNGSKYWRFKYLINGKEKLLALGVYPEITLVEAREKRLAARKQVANAIDPSFKRREDKRLAQFDANNNFEAIGREWHAANLNKWTPKHGAKILVRLENNIFPYLGHLPLKAIKPAELLDTIRKIENRGATELSRRVLQNCSGIFRYAIVTGRAAYNPAADLVGALKAHAAEHYPTIKFKELPQFLKKLEATNTSLQNKIAIKLLILTFVRQGELRQAKWDDIDFKAKEWRIPAHTTKMREAHIVPLSKPAIALLKELKVITGNGDYLFPSHVRRKHPFISENTINKVIKDMGYKGKLVGHGFRALASTTLNEMGFKPDIIERQLAHRERNKVRAAYNRAEYLAERREMMEKWGEKVW